MKKNKKALLCLLFVIAFSLHLEGQIITLSAGIGWDGFGGDGGPATFAELNEPVDVAIDIFGNLYIADAGNHRIRKVNNAGIISTIAGTDSVGYSGDGGPATAAKLYSPNGIAADKNGNIYISDASNFRIRKINTTGIITTVAGNGSMGYSGDGGPATAAELYSPYGVAVDGFGNLYSVDYYSNRIRKIDTSGIITTFAGSSSTHGYSGDGGPATAAKLYNPIGIAADNFGNIYFADNWNNCIRKVDATGIITTIAGGTGILAYGGDGGPATAASLDRPSNVVVDGIGNVYISEEDHRIRKINPDGIITTYAGNGTSGYYGNGGPADSSEFSWPRGLTLDVSGNLYIADYFNYCIRSIGSTLAVNSINKNAENIKVYPNPSFGQFTINISTMAEEPVEIIVSNVLGKKVKEITATTNKPIKIELDTPPGVYFINAIISNTILSEKIIISQ